jgi:predicted MPP superfamily phosphohydrolase
MLVLPCSAVWASTVPFDIDKDGLVDLKDLSQLSNYWLSKIEPICNFMAIADLHYGDFIPYESMNKRQPNAHDRFYSFISEANMTEPTFVIQLGDVVDERSEHIIPSLAEYVQDVNDLSDNQIFPVLGNHERGCLLNKLDPNDIGLFLDMLSETAPPNIENIWTYPDYVSYGNYPCAYTFDVGDSFRGLVLFFGTDLTWLASAIDVNRPVIAFAHNRERDTEVLNILSSSPNVIIYFKGHNHEGTYEVYNGLPIYGFKGSVMTPDFDNFTSNAYYCVNVGWLKNGASKNVYINIEGYGWGEDFFFVSDKDF